LVKAVYTWTHARRVDAADKIIARVEMILMIFLLKATQYYL
jgi:hypothetical protein